MKGCDWGVIIFKKIAVIKRSNLNVIWNAYFLASQFIQSVAANFVVHADDALSAIFHGLVKGTLDFCRCVVVHEHICFANGKAHFCHALGEARKTCLVNNVSLGAANKGDVSVTFKNKDGSKLLASLNVVVIYLDDAILVGAANYNKWHLGLLEKLHVLVVYKGAAKNYAVHLVVVYKATKL